MPKIPKKITSLANLNTAKRENDQMTDEKPYLLIHQLANQTGVGKDTIRHYHYLGLLKFRKRQAGSRFYNEYHPESIERIERIKLAQSAGFTLKEIEHYLIRYYAESVNIDEPIQILRNKIQQLKAQRDQLNTTIDLLSNELIRFQNLQNQNIVQINLQDYDKQNCEKPDQSIQINQ